MVELTLRLVFSLAVVIGLLMLLARFGSRRFNGSSSAPVRVLHRQSLSRASSVAVVSVGSRVLVLGTTDQHVSLLTELDPAELDPAHLDAAHQDALHPDQPEPEPFPAVLLDGDLQLVPAMELLEERPAGRHAAPRKQDGFADGPDLGQDAGVAISPEQSHQAARLAGRASARAARHAGVRPSGQGALAGSVLSPQTWRDALAAATGRAS